MAPRRPSERIAADDREPAAGHHQLVVGPTAIESLNACSRPSQMSADSPYGISKGASPPSSHEGKYERDYAQQHGVRELGLNQRQRSTRVAIRRDIRLHMIAVDDLREHAKIAIILDPAVDGFDHEHPTE